MMGIGAGKLLRMGTPVGAAMTAAGLGKDYYDFAQDEIEKMDAMSDYDRKIYNDMLMDEFSSVKSRLSINIPLQFEM